MKRGQEKLMSHILMVAAPLLVLLMITLAWFVNSRTIDLSEMSFAAHDSGPGAVIYKGIPDKTTRIYDKTTLTHSAVTWAERLEIADSDITINPMQPGQCEYYLLLSDKDFTPKLLNLALADATGQAVTTVAENEALLLTQAVGVYLIPVAVPLPPTPEQPFTQSVALTLEREASGKLSSTIFRGDPATAVLPAPTTVSKAYVLALFCDPVYGQNGPAADGKVVHAGTLPGTISFSLAFDTVGG